MKGIFAEEQIVATLLGKYGSTFAEQTRISLKNEPSPLFRLLMLCILQAKPISTNTEFQISLELKKGLITEETAQSASLRIMIAAFKEADYVRYNESSATYFHEAAESMLAEYGGDLREFHSAGKI